MTEAIDLIDVYATGDEDEVVVCHDDGQYIFLVVAQRLAVVALCVMEGFQHNRADGQLSRRT